MAELIEVREYEKITCNPDCKELNQYKYVDETAFQAIFEFVLEYNGNDETADAMDFLRQRSDRTARKVIIAQNYVGLIQPRRGIQVQILPKIDFSSSENRTQVLSDTKRVFLKMLRSMKDFPGKVFKEASMDVNRMNLYELFINMYLQEVRQLLKHGIKSGYITHEENLRFFKGRLLVGENIRANLVHKERFYMSYDEFDPNRSENKLIKSTLLKLLNLTQSSENAKEIRQMLGSFEMVSPSVNYDYDFSKVSINRTMKEYETLLMWSKVFLYNKSFTTFSGKADSRALLFPMEKLYESYVGQEIKKLFRADGWSVQTQDKGYYLFSEPERQFALRPDIVLKKGNRTVIMDTKWKALFNDSGKNYGISQADMYQMYAYSRKYHTPEIWLLYPMNNDMRGCPPIRFVAKEEGIPETDVRVFFVDLAVEDIQKQCLWNLAMEVNRNGGDYADTL